MRKLLFVLLLLLSSQVFAQTTTIGALPASTGVDATDDFACDEGAATNRCTGAQIAAYVLGGGGGEEEGEIGGTTVTGDAADDQVPLGSAASAASWVSVPDCTAGMLRYAIATNTFSCGSVSAEVNDLSAAVTWANVPDANVDGSAETDEVFGTLTDGSYCQGGAANTADCDVTQANIPGADHIDALSEIAAALRSGSDAELITGTIGTTNAVVAPDANDDLVEYNSLVWAVVAATCTGDGNGGKLTVDGTGQIICDTDTTGAGAGDIGDVGDCASGSCFVDGTDNGSNLVYEGATVDTNQTTLTFTGDPGGAFTVTIPNETGTICTTGSVCSGYDPTGGDDLSDDTPSALSGVTTMNDGQYCQGNASSGFDCDVSTIDESNLDANVVLDNAANTYSTGAQDFSSATSVTIPVAAGAAPTASGQLAYDSTANQFEYGDNTANRVVVNTDEAQTLSSKTLTTPTIGDFTNATHDHSNNAGGGDVALAGTSTGTTAAADDNDTSIATTAFVQQEINGSGGRSITAGSGQVAADAELFTDEKCAYIETPAVEDFDGLVHWMTAVTVTRVWCETDAGTVDLNIENDDGTPADVLTAELVCDTGEQTSCSSGCDVNTISGTEDAFAQYDEFNVSISAVSSATRVSVCVGITRDD